MPGLQFRFLCDTTDPELHELLPAMRARGIALGSNRVRPFAANAVFSEYYMVRYHGDQRLVIATVLYLCATKPGYLLTKTHDSASNADYMWGTFAEKGTVKIPNPPLTSGQIDPHNPAHRVKLSSQNQVTSRDGNWASLYSGLARKFVQCVNASGHDNPLSYRFWTTHGIYKAEKNDGKRTREKFWLLEVGTGGVFAAPVKMRGCCSVWNSVSRYLPRSDEPQYQELFEGKLSLHWIFLRRQNSGVVRLLNSDQMESAMWSAPLSTHMGWAFNYSGSEAQSVQFKANDIINCWEIKRVKIQITGTFEEGPTHASHSVVEENPQFVNSTDNLIWYPHEYLTQYEQLYCYDLNTFHPPLAGTAPLDVIYGADDTEYVTRVTQFDPSGETTVEWVGECTGEWEFGSNPRMSSATEITKGPTYKGNILSTPSSSLTIEAGYRRDTLKTSSDAGRVWYLNGVNFEVGAGYYAEFIQIARATFTSDTSENIFRQKGAVVFDFFDREGVLSILKDDRDTTVMDGPHVSENVLSETESEGPLSTEVRSYYVGLLGGEGSEQTAVPLDPAAYVPADACDSYGPPPSPWQPDRVTIPAEVVSTPVLTYKLQAYIGGRFENGVAAEIEQSTVDKLMLPRDGIILPMIEDVSVYGMSSAKSAGGSGSSIVNIRTAEGQYYVGELPATPDGHTYAGYCGDI